MTAPESGAGRKTHSHVTPCRCGANTWFKAGSDDGSLADGGSYDVCECTNCGKRFYVQIAD